MTPPGPGQTLDRRAHLRADPHMFERLLSDPATGVLIVSNAHLPLIQAHDDGPPGLAFLSPTIAEPLRDDAIVCYLGADRVRDYVAFLVGDQVQTPRGARPAPVAHPLAARLDWPADVSWIDMVDVVFELSGTDLALASAGAALAGWHPRARHCSTCGAATLVKDAGWTRWCATCQADHFPRTDPVVIVRVLDDHDRLLLGHAATWKAGRFSLPAGFVEAGESLEDAVVRELREETAVEVTDIRYLTSQPWPMPRSLMCAFDARATSSVITVDNVELTEARWFTRDELIHAIANGDVELGAPGTASRHVIDEWMGLSS